MISFSYKGNPDSEETHALIGKGVIFDAGGLNIKPTGGIEGMFLDKHGTILNFIYKFARRCFSPDGFQIRCGMQVKSEPSLHSRHGRKSVRTQSLSPYGHNKIPQGTDRRNRKY